jgi:hypothetical protein
VQGHDEGFLRIIENSALTSALGLNSEPFGEVRAYVTGQPAVWLF